MGTCPGLAAVQRERLLWPGKNLARRLGANRSFMAVPRPHSVECTVSEVQRSTGAPTVD